MTAPRPTVAVMAPGDMGHAVGRVLAHAGLRVITSLEGRSARTRALAKAAGIEDVGSDAALVRDADVLLAILVPAEAPRLARRIADAVRAEAASLVYVECNAIAPATVLEAAEVVTASGATFVDGGIIGGPPRLGAAGPRIYVSGPDLAAVASLRDFGLDVRAMGQQVGQASTLKMCYAALTKGTCSLMTQLSIVAERLGASEALRAEFAASQPHHLAWMQAWVPSMVPKAHRWVGEMEEIAKTFAAAGVTPGAFEAAAETYRGVAASELADVSPEAWAEAGRTLEEVVRALAEDDLGR